jgi:putative phosphoribosyl transferase
VRFRDRSDAGRQLARRLLEERPPGPILVLGLPRGGIPVAAQVAEALHAPMEVFVARKIGAPGHEELGIAAVAEGSDEVLLTETAKRVGVGPEEMPALAARARREVRTRVETYRRGRELPDLTGRTVILVDDGLATGITAEVALRSLRRLDPQRLVLASPVCAAATRDRLRPVADEVICLRTPKDFLAVGQWYEHFDQTSDEEVLDLLAGGHAGGRTHRG